jgi:hypothetical protein
VSLSALLVAVAGCSNSKDSSQTELVPTVQIDSFVSTLSTVAASVDSVPALPLGCDGFFVTNSSFTNFTTHAPGGCGATQRCGHVRVDLFTEGSDYPLSSTEVVSSPALFTLSSIVVAQTTLRVRATLVLDDGSDYLRAGASIYDERSVVVDPPSGCDATAGSAQ